MNQWQDHASSQNSNIIISLPITGKPSLTIFAVTCGTDCQWLEVTAAELGQIEAHAYKTKLAVLLMACITSE